MTISCDVCGDPVPMKEIYTDEYNNTLCVKCYNDKDNWEKNEESEETNDLHSLQS